MWNSIRINAIRGKLAGKIAPKIQRASGYYEQTEYCQIATLSHLYTLFLGNNTSGSFVEIGANDGYYVSNSWGLARRGWIGLMCEPVKDLAEKCRSAHKEHVNVTVLETAVGPPGVDSLTLLFAGALTSANSSLIREYANLTWAQDSLTNRKLVVPCQTLNSLLQAHGYQEGFDVLIVDVEGFEKEVFQGLDLSFWQPKLIILELSDTHPDLLSTCKSDAELSVGIEGSGYRIVYKDMTNTVFVRYDIWRKAYDFQ